MNVQPPAGPRHGHGYIEPPAEGDVRELEEAALIAAGASASAAAESFMMALEMIMKRGTAGPAHGGAQPQRRR